VIGMVCRVRVRLKCGEREVDAVALLSSGFESDAPDIAVPISVAERLGLWPPREGEEAETAILETGGGDVAVVYYEDVAELQLIIEDRPPKVVRIGVLVNPHLDEVLISDYVASELGVILLDFREGLWRLKDDPPDKVRESVR